MAIEPVLAQKDNSMINEIVPWKTDLNGALVEYSPTAARAGLFTRYGLRPGMRGIVTKGQWVSNYSVGTAFCAHDILWTELGCCSKDIGMKLAHFTSKDIKVIALA